MKNIVIIGASSYAGTPVAQALASDTSLPQEFRVIAIEKTVGGYHTLGGLRAAVVPGAEDKMLVASDKVIPAKSRHLLLNFTQVTSISKNSVTVDKAHPEHGLDTQIDFDYLVIATGTNYNFPARLNSTNNSLQEAKADFKTFQGQVKTAKDILIVGGGAVGLEFAGEVAAQYPTGKNVTLVNAGPYLVETMPKKFGDSITNTLRKDFNVQVLLNEKVDIQKLKSGPVSSQTYRTTSGKEITADFVFDGTGGRVDTGLVQTFDPSLITDTHQIKVKPTLQVDKAGYEHMFVLGDAAATNTPRTAYGAGLAVPIVTKNLLALIKGNGAALKEYKGPPAIMVVSLGPKKGAASMFGFNAPNFFAVMIKSKDLMIGQFNKVYQVVA